MDKRSKQRMNRYGESGSPCLKPRLGTTSGRGEPFQSMWNRVEEIIFMMEVIRVGAAEGIQAYPKYNATPADHRLFQDPV